MKILKITAAFVVIVVAMAVFSATLVHALWYAPDPSEVAVAANNAPVVVATSSIPERLEIPRLGIDAKVQETGINAKGGMGVPTNFTDVAWYRYGPAPGELGSAVIDGHVDNGLGLAGVFKHLGDIEVGDDVYVVDTQGDKLHFKVTDVESYPYTSAPVQQIFQRADAARLNLITCEGHWVKADKTYDQRLVIYTELQKS